MSLIVTLRPSATSSSTGWTAQPSGTLHGVTSDNSDSTYALWSGTGLPMVLQTPADAPGAGLRRHQVRVRARGQLGNAWWAVRLQSGELTGGATREFPSSPETSVGSWGFGAPPDGTTILAAHVEGQSTGLRINEIFLDVDFRSKPDFTPQLLDGTSTVTTTITDTATPTLHAAAVNLDALPAMQYRYWVTSGATIVWDTGIVSGSPVDTQTSPLPNGAYTAHYVIWTLLGGSYAYASDEKTLGFTVSVGQVAKPNDPVVEQRPGTPLWDITVCAPDMRDLDGDAGYIEIQRVGCVGSDSPTATSIAQLGPLMTDQCATYTDFSAPRTGRAISADCDHETEQCCSYYRARTIGRISGSVVISAWSDVTDPGLPQGLIFAWPSTAASIPAGWSRQIELDSTYVKGVATSTTQPGTLGGSTTHTHTVPTHSHDISHSHTAGNTSAAVGSVSSGAGGAGTQGVPATHTHTRPTTSSTVLASPSVATPVVAQTNDLDRLDVVFIESDGTASGVPDGALGYAPDVSLTGWTDYVGATTRYLKGAAPGGDGGGIFASGVIQHTHTLSAHTHGGVAHTHTSGNTGNVAGTLSLTGGGPNSVTYSVNHAHPITVNSGTTADLTGGASVSGQSSAGVNEPPWKNVRVKQNTSGGDSIPVGLIGMWRGSLGTIPASWHLCDGTNGTIDLTGRYPKGATTAIGAVGGSTAAHTHTSPTHIHTTTGHTHTETIGAQNGSTANAVTAANVSVATGTHTHTGSTDSTTPTVGATSSGTLAAATSEPEFEEIAFVQLVEPFVPDPGPDTFCLTWSDDEHLIRSTSAGGALWAPLKGMVSGWSVDRPVTGAFGVNGSRFVQNGAPGERNPSIDVAVESEAELQALLAVLARPLVLISPSDSREVWAAPIASSVQVVKVGRIRRVTADFIGTGPEPAPQVADV